MRNKLQKQRSIKPLHYGRRRRRHAGSVLVLSVGYEVGVRASWWINIIPNDDQPPHSHAHNPQHGFKSIRPRRRSRIASCRCREKRFDAGEKRFDSGAFSSVSVSTVAVTSKSSLCSVAMSSHPIPLPFLVHMRNMLQKNGV